VLRPKGPVRRLLERRRLDDQVGQDARIDAFDDGRHAAPSRVHRRSRLLSELLLGRRVRGGPAGDTGSLGRLRARRFGRRLSRFPGALHETHEGSLATVRPADQPARD